MNQFTKEELQYLASCPSVGCREVLINKIKSMIDNYCEHEWKTNIYDYILYCQKCGETTKSDEQGKILG